MTGSTIDPQTPPPGTPTQVAHPNKAALRTFVQAAIPAILFALTVLPQIVQAVLDEPSLPAALRGWLVAAAALLAALGAILSRIMAIPGLQDFLIGIGLGTGVETEGRHAR